MINVICQWSIKKPLTQIDTHTHTHTHRERERERERDEEEEEGGREILKDDSKS